MKNHFTAAFARQVYRLSLLVTLTFILGQTTSAQLTNNSEKPKAILFSEWSEPDANAQAKILPVRSQVRARIVKNPVFNSDYNPVSPVVNQPEANYPAVSYKYVGRFGYLKPTALEQKAFDLINEQRRLKNLSALEWDLGMLYIARQHSENMARLSFFSHTGRDGKTVDKRADAAGIEDWRSIGENIAYNQGIKNTVDFAVQCWMYSPSHKENLLNKKWKRSGIGVAVSPDGKFYITQVFRN